MTTRRPPFLDWRYWVCMAVSVLIADNGVVHALSLEQSNWRILIYGACGVIAGWAHEQWADWLEASKRAKS
jgi:hypothetical protein